MSNEPLTVRSARIKAARKLTRRASRTIAREFLAEGPQAVREALAVDGCVRELYVDEHGWSRHSELVGTARDHRIPVVPVTEEALGSIAETVAPQGMVALCGFLDVSLAEILDESVRLVAICAHVRDPGNAGTVLRCADAAGADAVIFAGDCVDPYNGKAVRASVGSLFHLPVVTGVTVDEATSGARGAGLRVLAADGGSSTTLDDPEVAERLGERTAWLFGNEAWGLPAADVALADLSVGVPIYGAAESLNLATAAAVCLYASARAARQS